jgi:TonB family protein
VLKLPDSYYHISYLDYPTHADTDEFASKTLQAGRDGMLANNKSMELVGEREVAQNGVKGSEYLILQDKFSFGIIRAFVIHGRLYQLGVLAPTELAFRRAQPSTRAEDRTEFFNLLATRFLDSFKLLESVDEKPSESPAEVDEVDQMVAQLKSQKKDVVVAACCGSDAGGNSNGILNGKALHLVTPPYPALARSAHAGGQVSVKVLIDLDGNVAAAQAVEGNPLLRAASVKAARETKFTPTLLEGKPVILVGIIIYNFVRQ